MPAPIETIRVTLGPEPAHRLDKALAAVVPEGSGLSRSRLQVLIAEGAVAREDGAILIDPRVQVAPGTGIVITLPPAVPDVAEPQAIPIEIVHEDEDLVVIDKPAGLVVHPAAGAPGGTLVNALLHHCGGSLSGIGGTIRPGIVHRIDKDTSGLLVAAKTDRAHQGLAEQFADHSIDRRYLAITHGAPERSDPRLAGLAGISWEPDGALRIEGNIGRHPGDRKRMAVLGRGGKRAVTRVRILERFEEEGAPLAALVECRLETGRTHQIRVHMSFTGHALVGDRVYGRKAGNETLAVFPRQALHAAHLGFRHPVTGRDLAFASAWPKDLADLITSLRHLS
jgi:23S rRNA pseudouridine1911/1915/1917 synthase